jgi:hypothetical protein
MQTFIRGSGKLPGAHSVPVEEYRATAKLGYR